MGLQSATVTINNAGQKELGRPFAQIMADFDVLGQNCGNSVANALRLLQLGAKSSITTILPLLGPHSMILLNGLCCDWDDQNHPFLIEDMFDLTITDLRVLDYKSSEKMTKPEKLHIYWNGTAIVSWLPSMPSLPQLFPNGISSRWPVTQIIIVKSLSPVY